MAIHTEFLETLAFAAQKSPGPRSLPWPMPGSPGGIVVFNSFQDWQKSILEFKLSNGVPLHMAGLFDRALKLHLIAWLDFDLITAGELASFAALEHSLRDCYLGTFRDNHTRKVVARAKNEGRDTTAEEAFDPKKIKLSDLLRHMHQRDGLTDQSLPSVRKYGGSILDLLKGQSDPGLSEIRNVRAHGNPFGSGYRSGLLELVRDLIEYAYRDKILQAKNNPTWANFVMGGESGDGELDGELP